MSIRKSTGFTRETLRRLSGARAFERGEEYAASRRVASLTEDQGRITARVRGTHTYGVTLWTERGALRHSCTCPVGDDGVCCKHCVAVGLTWLDDPRDTPTFKRTKKERSLTEKDVRAHLREASTETLVKLLMDHAMDDDRLRQRLLLRAAKSTASGVNLETYREAIDDAVDTQGFVEYGAARGYARRIDEVIHSIEKLMPEGHAAEVVDLCEYGLRAIERAMGSVDDSDGNMSELLHRLQTLHCAACVITRPDPGALARKLFAWELGGEWEVFLGAASTYAKVLGKHGLAIYRELAEVAWSRVPALGPGEKDPVGFSKRFRITHIMETLAGLSGDTDALIAIRKRDLSLPYGYLQVAELYQRDRRDELALEWAERGVKAFPLRADSRLREFLANAYHRAKRHDEAMRLMWQAFEESPHLAEYQNLKRHATPLRQWAKWRDKALALLRDVASRASRHMETPRWTWTPRLDRSELVRVFLWERNLESAWREATEGGCSGDLWMVLARKRERAHPGDAIRVYQQAVEPVVERKNNEAYREALGLLRDVRRLMERLGRGDDFRPYVASVRAKHKVKRNFVKMIDGARF